MHNSTRLTAIAAAVLLATMAGGAMADDVGSFETPDPVPASTDTSMDDSRATDRDTAASERFIELDVDNNGMLSATEAVGDKDLSARWNDLDVNNDRTLDTAEFAAFEGSLTIRSTTHE